MTGHLLGYVLHGDILALRNLANAPFLIIKRLSRLSRGEPSHPVCLLVTEREVPRTTEQAGDSSAMSWFLPSTTSLFLSTVLIPLFRCSLRGACRATSRSVRMTNGGWLRALSTGCKRREQRRRENCSRSFFHTRKILQNSSLWIIPKHCSLSSP